VFSFLTTLTLGILATVYNEAMFKHKFNHVLEQAGVPPPARDIRLFDRMVRARHNVYIRFYVWL
jgi:hypothetical protein